MGKRWLLAAMLAAGTVLVAVTMLGPRRTTRDPAAGPLSTPVALPSIGAELLFVSAPSITRRGSPQIVVLRLSRPASLVPHHFRDEGLEGPRPIEEWARRLNAPVVFNAGQFDEHLNHLGWLKADGKWLSRLFKPAWKGLLVSAPLGKGPWGQVVDLEAVDAEVAERYGNVVQSMMLVDHKARVRVRTSDRTACRTVVAEDTEGRLLVVVTEGAMTLADLARWLPQSGLDIVRAMNLDGGVESQLYVNTPELQLAIYGQYGTGTTVLEEQAGQMIRHPLPAVVALHPGGDG